MKPTFFKTSWDATLVILTLGCSVLAIGPFAAMVVFTRGDIPQSVRVMLAAAALLVLVMHTLSYLLAPQGFEISDTAITIKRPIRKINIARADIITVSTVSERQIGASARVMGNNGLFGYYGSYKNKDFGTYLLYTRHMSGLVLIETANQKYILGPDNPAGFMDAIKPLKN